MNKTIEDLTSQLSKFNKAITMSIFTSINVTKTNHLAHIKTHTNTHTKRSSTKQHQDVCSLDSNSLGVNNINGFLAPLTKRQKWTIQSFSHPPSAGLEAGKEGKISTCDKKNSAQKALTSFDLLRRPPSGMTVSTCLFFSSWEDVHFSDMVRGHTFLSSLGRGEKSHPKY